VANVAGVVGVVDIKAAPEDSHSAEDARFHSPGMKPRSSSGRKARRIHLQARTAKTRPVRSSAEAGHALPPKSARKPEKAK
jgi:hypothetical protein